MRNLRVFILVFITVGSFLVDLRAQSPLPKAFEHSYQEIQEAFKSRPTADESAGRETLLYEAIYRYDEKGSLSQSVRMIWNVRQKLLAEVGTLSCRFSPWYQKQPIIEARVFDRNGKIYELTKDDATVSSAQSNDPVVLTNDQIVRAALPGLQDGSIVEERITVEEQMSYFPKGNYRIETLDSFVPMQFSSIEIDAPESLPLRVVFLGKEYPIQETRENGRIRKRIELKKVVPVDTHSFESYLPKTIYPFNQVAICVGGSWDKIAEGYSEIVDGQLQGMDFAPLVKEAIPAEVTTPLEKLHASFNWIKKNFRYTGVSLGQASIVPARPMQLLARRFGDCKDQAALLVGMLREIGIEAHVALVNASGVRAPYEHVPGLNAFDHAITVATVDGKQYWLDCTHLGSTLVNVPSYLQGKSVLIAATGTQALTSIPLESAEVNSVIEDKTLIFQNGFITTLSSETHSGMYGAESRPSAMTKTVEQSEKEVMEAVQKENPVANFKILNQDDPWTMERVFRRTTKFEGTPLEEVDYSSSRFIVAFNRLVSELPQLYLMEPTGGNKVVSRKQPAEVFVPFKRRRTYIIQPVEGWELQVNLTEKNAEVGCVQLLRKASKRDDGSFYIEMEASATAGTLSPEQLKQLYDIAKTFDDPLSDWNIVAIFREKHATEDMARPQAIAKLKLRWETEKSGAALIDYVDLLCASALTDEARWITQKAVELNPQDANMRVAKGMASFYDLAGRGCYPGMDRNIAEEELRAAKKLDPKNLSAFEYLASLAFRDIDSLKRKTAGDFPKCLELIEECLSIAKVVSAPMRDLQITSLALLDRVPEAIAVAESYQLDRMVTSFRCFELAKASRWNEVKQLRAQIGADRELKAQVAEVVTCYLENRQMYAAAAQFVEAFAYPDEKRAQDLAKYYRTRSPIELDVSPTSTPERVALELLRRIHTSGTQWNWWSDIIVNPESSSQSLEKFASIALADMRSLIRTRTVGPEQVSGMIQDKLAVSGNDESGYRCLLTRGSIRVPIFVTKRDAGYMVILPGENGTPLAEKAQALAAQGKLDDAIKCVDWCMELFPDPAFLVVESGIPAEVIWTSTRKKTPELLDQVCRMLHTWTGNVDARYKEALSWIEVEKSNSRRIQLQRYMLANLEKENSPQFVDEANKFLQTNPAFSMIRRSLSSHLIDAGRLDEARKVFHEGDAHLSLSDREIFEKRLKQAVGDYQSDLPQLKKKAEQSQSPGDWDMFLWASLFADELDVEVVKLAAGKIRSASDRLALNTLACAEAKTGLIDEAVEDLRLLLLKQNEKFRPADWLVIGFIAERCNLPEAAIRAYGKVENEAKRSSATSANSLANRRILALQAR